MAPVSKSSIRVFVGQEPSDWAGPAKDVVSKGLGISVPASNHDCMCANRLSYVLGLKGESLTILTACSSSLVAVALALKTTPWWESTEEGRTSLVLGNNLMLYPEPFVENCAVRLLSPGGRC